MFGVIKRNPTLSPTEILRVMAFQREILDVPLSPECSYTGYARFALYNILKTLNLDRGSEILLPAYICDVVRLPLDKLGIVPIFYGITDRFQIDYDSIKLSKETKAMITVNYFGMSQDFGLIDAFVKKHELVWINDNSHGFAGKHEETKLESYGDFSITSFRKVLPTVNGAIARINNEVYQTLIPELVRLNQTSIEEHKKLRFFGATLLGILRYRPWLHPDYSVMSVGAETEIQPFRLDKISSRVLCMTPENEVQKRRYEIYQAIELFLLKQQYDFIELIPDVLHAGNSPLVYPVRVKDKHCWKAILRISRSAGIDIHTWPDLPQEVIVKNLFGCVDMWEKLLYFPIQQDLDAESYCLRLANVLDLVKR